MSGKPHKIETLFAFIAETEDGEGVCAFKDSGTNTWVPLIGSDKDRVESYMKLAKDISNNTGQTIKVYQFSKKEYLTTIEPE